MKGASVYQRLGWRVLPLHDVSAGVCSCAKGAECQSAGKHPRITGWSQDASNDPDVIAEWAEQWPNANLGVLTGTGSGFFVLDVDPDHDGDQTLAELQAEHGELPATARARTGSGGEHYLFQLPDFPVTNKAGKTGIGVGLDIRGDGGQIVVAPSRSAKGVYRWIAPPWSTPIAPAPAWLLDLLRARSHALSPESDRVVSTERGYFPPATAELLAEARAALQKHGPAIEDDGGGLHTVHAAALLTHDFALTDAEAWPLFVEWNETCQPPWVLEGPYPSLRVMLARGAKYGKMPYGCRRELPALDQGRKLIADWRGTGKDPSALIETCRALTFTKDAERTLFLRELKEATDWTEKELRLPKAVAPVQLSDKEILVTTELAKVADLATAAIRQLVFQRNGILCEVVGDDRTFISELKPARIQDLMSQCAKFVRHDDNKGKVSQVPPESVASVLHARRAHKEVRILESVTTAPIFLADGSILQERGYNEQARVFLVPSVTVDVPESPTRDDARNAVRVFKDLLSDFQFLGKPDFSSWLAALLSPLVKSAIGNAPVPLICVSASSPGAGKTLLTEVIGQIVMGTAPGVYPYNPRDPAEWGKRLTAFVKAANPLTVFDNVNGPFGDESLDKLITSSVWTDRILGASEAPPLPNVTTWMATGNNLEPINDTVRRVLMIRIEVNTERPQERKGFKRPLLAEYAAEHRAELLSAALTILRAFHLAGRPSGDLAPWGSFTAWSALVRGALTWTGLPDPYLTQARAAAELNEPENDAHDFWIGVIETSDGTPQSISEICANRDAQSVLGLREAIGPLHLKRFVGRFVDKPRGQKRIRRTRVGDAIRYYVERIASAPV